MPSFVKGEYCRVADRIREPELLQKAYLTPITETDAEYLVKHFLPNADVIFYPDIRSEAVDASGNYYIRFANNPLTIEDIENEVVYPRLQLGVVLHEIAHLWAGVSNGHGIKFVEALDHMLVKCSSDKWRELVATTIEQLNLKKKIAKSISKIVKETCPTCHKPVVIKSTAQDIANFYHELECNHLYTVSKVKPAGPIDGFMSVNQERLYNFQKENVEVFGEANGRLAILDEMGLGKTPQIIAIAHVYNLFPAVIVVKSGLRHQWRKMCEYWGNVIDPEFGVNSIEAQVIDNAKSHAFAGAHFYIVSYDLLPLLPDNFFKQARTSLGKTIPLNIKLLAIDECQHIKNPESNRTRALFKVAQGIPNVIAASGTPIKNNGMEFYPMLHLLKPSLFPERSKFAKEWLDVYTKGPYIKYGGIRNYEKFKEATQSFIVRHTQAEVLPDLPDITRNFVYTELAGSAGNEYRELAKKFKEYYYKTSKEDREFFNNILAFFVEMRHLTGRAKIQEAIDFAIEFLESTERKLTIFTHHIDVREAVTAGINDYLKEKGMKPCLELVGSMDGFKKEDLKTKFNYKPEYRVLVASTLASGEGHNLQHACSDCLMLERQWNPANEEQAEFRFKRPGQKSAVINATYLIALDTIDEYFTTLVENKRMLVKHSLDGVKPEWNQNAILQELAQILATRAN